MTLVAEQGHQTLREQGRDNGTEGVDTVIVKFVSAGGAGCWWLRDQ